MRKVFQTSNAPAPIGPYNQAIWAGNTLYISGQVAIDPKTGSVSSGNSQEQVRILMTNLKAIVEDAGLSMSDIVKTSVFVIDMDEYPLINEVYGEFFDDDTAPARELVQVSRLPAGVRVEVSAIAYKASN